MGNTIPQVTIKNCIVVLEDSIVNSVFEGQIIRPLQQYAKKYPKVFITIISFEKKLISLQTIKKIIPKNFTYIQLKKYPFLGTWTLKFAIRNLYKILSSYDNYQIVARGPIAGYVTAKAQTSNCKQIVIQARGILSEEYDYAHCANSRLTYLHRLRKYLYYLIEKKAYSLNKSHIFFEAVSPALKKYLIDMYKLRSEKITIAHDDIPSAISLQQKRAWRSMTRKQLKITEHVTVYCYNGSAKPWQCPHETIQFFSEKLKDDPEAFLLILSQDYHIFLSLIQQHCIPQKNYQILHVPHKKIFSYLAAADVGLLFRKSHIMNWISRPTKFLEYRALDIPVVHNNTVAYLVKEQ